MLPSLVVFVCFLQLMASPSSQTEAFTTENPSNANMAEADLTSVFFRIATSLAVIKFVVVVLHKLHLRDSAQAIRNKRTANKRPGDSSSLFQYSLSPIDKPTGIILTLHKLVSVVLGRIVFETVLAAFFACRFWNRTKDYTLVKNKKMFEDKSSSGPGRCRDRLRGGGSSVISSPQLSAVDDESKTDLCEVFSEVKSTEFLPSESEPQLEVRSKFPAKRYSLKPQSTRVFGASIRKRPLRKMFCGPCTKDTCINVFLMTTVAVLVTLALYCLTMVPRESAPPPPRVIPVPKEVRGSPGPIAHCLEWICSFVHTAKKPDPPPPPPPPTFMAFSRRPSWDTMARNLADPSSKPFQILIGTILFLVFAMVLRCQNAGQPVPAENRGGYQLFEQDYYESVTDGQCETTDDEDSVTDEDRLRSNAHDGFPVKTYKSGPITIKMHQTSPRNTFGSELHLNTPKGVVTLLKGLEPATVEVKKTPSTVSTCRNGAVSCRDGLAVPSKVFSVVRSQPQNQQGADICLKKLEMQSLQMPTKDADTLCKNISSRKVKSRRCPKKPPS